MTIPWVKFGLSLLLCAHRTGILQKIVRACIISCMHAYRLNQTGKSSFRDSYHDNENHDYDHDTDLKTSHTVRVPSRGYHRHITTAKNGQKTPKTTKTNKKTAILRFGLFWPLWVTKSKTFITRTGNKFWFWSFCKKNFFLAPLFDHFLDDDGCWILKNFVTIFKSGTKNWANRCKQTITGSVYIMCIQWLSGLNAHPTFWCHFWKL